MGVESFVHVKGREPAMRQMKVKTRRPARLGIDVPLLLVVSSLMLFGMLMVYSASADYSYQVYGSPSYIFLRQLRWLGLGSLAMLMLAFVNYHLWKKLALPLMAVPKFALVAVLLI